MGTGLVRCIDPLLRPPYFIFRQLVGSRQLKPCEKLVETKPPRLIPHPDRPPDQAPRLLSPSRVSPELLGGRRRAHPPPSLRRPPLHLTTSRRPLGSGPGVLSVSRRRLPESSRRDAAPTQRSAAVQELLALQSKISSRRHTTSPRCRRSSAPEVALTPGISQILGTSS
ncbi:hypothetical protein BRADI_1g14346v3 [Brachypodium distachyon]|uniref:Uncharacterized protein n=1 Tax=Brachypodium distachyon TaxID=15368 RepID=A0A0Q3J8D6_BRADI|nr:hypothetical protein BRADI_1g14346v3 [Brachypodium distachyon]